MSRESRRDRKRLERQDEPGEASAAGAAEGAAPAGSGAPGKRAGKGRTGPGEYVGEVRSELRRVHWPGRKELTQYSVVVLVAVMILGAYIFSIDQVFGQLVLWMFGS